MKAGVSEAARRALSAMCHTYREELQHTKFCYFPRHSKGAHGTQISVPPPEERSPIVDATQELVAALTTDLDAAAVEIHEMKEELVQLCLEKELMMAQLRGDEEQIPPSDSDEDRFVVHEARSPSRKRIRFGEPDYHTRYL